MATLEHETIEKGSLIAGKTVKEPFLITYEKTSNGFEAKTLGFCVAIGKTMEQSRKHLMMILECEIETTTAILAHFRQDMHQQYAHVIHTYQKHFDLTGNN
jgi:hypothetical protein